MSLTFLAAQRPVLATLLCLVLSCLQINAGAIAQAVPSDTVPQQQETPLKIVLALGGGGTRGCAHIGVIRALEKEGIKFDGIAGTSMGAIIGGLYCAGLSIDEIEDRLLNKSLLHAYHTVPIPIRLAVVPIFFIPHLFGHRPYDGLYKGNRFRNYLNNSVPECGRNIEELRIPFRAVAANLLDAKPYAIKSGNLGLAIQASSAIPVLRRPVPVEDKLFVDGGIQANLPAKQAREMGADLVIAVNCDETFPPVPPSTFRHIGSVSHRVISMLLSKVDEDQPSAADVVIHPGLNGIHLLSTNMKEARRAIAEGEKATLEAMPAIRAKIEQIKKERLAEREKRKSVNGITMSESEAAADKK
ncbi:MAG TPA: patatin-like phospholipase family protein [Candidatus Obscuribacterales bacterium]